MLIRREAVIVVMKIGATEAELKLVCKKAEELDFATHVIYGKERNVVGLIGVSGNREGVSIIEELPGVDKVVPISKPYKLASREVKEDASIVDVAGVKFGGEDFIVIAGPCSVEREDQIVSAAVKVKEAGARMLRGGAFKPRTSPYSFRGLGEDGLRLLAKAREATGLPIVTEVVDPKDIDLVNKYADMFQVGARNIQNFALLSLLGQARKPILLKRGPATTIDEFLMAAEYILSENNRDLVLCERGIRTFETATRNTLDVSCVPVVKAKSHLPIIIDPSHAAGQARYVPALSKAAVAVGADGLIIEVHPDPEKALCDGPQSLNPTQFAVLMHEMKAIAAAVGRRI